MRRSNQRIVISIGLVLLLLVNVLVITLDQPNVLVKRKNLHPRVNLDRILSQDGEVEVYEDVEGPVPPGEEK
jgi:hypothetical protein